MEFLQPQARAGVDDRLVLAGPEGRHAAAVLRIQSGELIDLVDGAGLRLSCEVLANTGAQLQVQVRSVAQEAMPALALVLVQALAKEQRDLHGVEASVECGADAVIPWAANRSVVTWRGDKVAKGEAKWAGVVRAATKQSRRAYLPPVEALVTSKQLAARIADAVAAGGGALVLHEGAEVAIADAALPQGDNADVSSADPARSELLVIVGPEGGITPDELAWFGAAGAQQVRLGPHVLRASTAGPVAIAVLSQRLGRWELA